MGQRFGRIRLVLLTLIGLGACLAGWNLWAAYHLGTARRALEQRHWAEAHAQLLLCLWAWPGSAEAHLLAARACRQLKAYDEAEQHLRACQHPEKIDAAVELEWALLRAQRGELPRVAEYLLACCRQNHPETPLILETLTQAYARAHNLTRALQCANWWVGQQPESASAHFWRGRMREQMFLYLKAMDDYRRAVELDPRQDEARLRLAEHLLRTGEAAEALAHYERLAQEQPDNETALFGVARCRNELHEPEAARPLIERLLAAHPEDGLLLIERGKVALEDNQPAEAEKYLRRALERAPYERAANSLLSECLKERGRPKEAQEYLERAHRIDGEMRRLQQLTQHVAEAPGDLAARYEIGTILLRNGHEPEGVDWLDRVLALDPGYRPAHQVLADYYRRTGNLALAARHQERAREDSSSPPSGGVSP